jgi:hypothetical protein
MHTSGTTGDPENQKGLKMPACPYCFFDNQTQPGISVEAWKTCSRHGWILAWRNLAHQDWAQIAWCMSIERKIKAAFYG